jgi:hypothetical protein
MQGKGGQAALRLVMAKTVRLLQLLYIFRFQALGALRQIESHALAFMKRFKAVAQDGGMMNKDVSVVLAGNETIPSGFAEIGNGTVTHMDYAPFSEFR